MSLTKQSAWLIFESDKLGREEGKEALKRMTKDEFDAYECWVEDFELAVAKVQIAAQNEAAALTENNIDLQVLDAKKHSEWLAQDYITFLSVLDGSQYERLHLSALFRIANAELLLSLAKPES